MMMKVAVLMIALIWFGCSVYGQRDRGEVANDLTFDQAIFKAMNGDNKIAAGLTLLDPNKTLAELDMFLTKKQFDAMYGKSGRTKRKAVSDETVYWANGRVPYKFNTNDFSAYEQWMIKVAMREWEKYTCIRFYEAGSSDTNYVYFQNGFGCNSQLGMVGGEQALNLDRNGCRFKGLYLHEIAHALGVVHEHQRPIRDNYITILYQNVEPNMRIWFQKYNLASINSHNVDYELHSVMHYGVKAFSGNQKQTIRAKDNTKESDIGRVYLKELSFTDVEIVNRMYKCVKEPSECDGRTCKGKGYLDQNCNCICPDGSQECTTGATIDNSCRNNANTDRENWRCYIWARQGECERNPGYMNARCAKACGQCGDERKELIENGLCENIYDDSTCDKWKDEVGDCRVAEHFMRKYCKKTCGYCDDFTSNRTPPQTQCMNTHTNDTACEIWARTGECIINSRWMLTNCQKACFTCSFDQQGSATIRPRSSTTVRETHVTTRFQTRARITHQQSTTIRPMVTTGDCVNIFPDKDCDVWAKYGHCASNPTFMKPNCKRSCKFCQTIIGGRGLTTTPGLSDCRDTWKNSEMCPIWAADNQCNKNPSFMLNHCAKSCSSCT